MAERGIVLGFYQDRAVALEVLTLLRSNPRFQSAVIVSDENGKTTVTCNWSLMRGKLSPSLILKYSRWLVRNEALVIIQALPVAMRQAVDTLHLGLLAPTATFVLLPSIGATDLPYDEFSQAAPATLEALQAEAVRLAEVHVQAGTHRGGARPLNDRLSDSEAILNQVQESLSTAVRTGQPVSMSAEWLLDNAYILQGHIDEFRSNLPARFYDELPRIGEGPQIGLPRVYTIATRLISIAHIRLDREWLDAFLRTYQGVSELTMAELWALPLMLRLRMIECVRHLAIQVVRRQRESELADFYANRLLTAARQDRDRLLPFVTELAKEQPDPSTYLADQLSSYLYDEERALASLTGWLEYRLGAPLVTSTQQEHLNQTTELVALANAIAALRHLARYDWREAFEGLCGVEAILRRDPSGVYPNMDFNTRDQYRHVVEETARRSGHSEKHIAELALAMATSATTDLTRHVGYYLADAGKAAIEAQTGCRPPLTELARRYVRKNSEVVYPSAVALISILVLWSLIDATASAKSGAVVLMSFTMLAMLPASEIALQIVNHLVIRQIPPRALPRMRFDAGIPEEFTTLVIVPMMLLTPDSICDEVAQLEIRYLANTDPNLLFGLLSDYSDAPQRDMPEDIERLDVAIQAIQKLSARYGPGRFYLFHRDRQWSKCEERWIGWERKRGKLEHLNRFLVGNPDPEQPRFLRSGDPAILSKIRFVITLDADTQLPRDTARHLIETLAHPLNQPQLSPDGREVERGYTIVQPGVSTSLPSATSTRFSRIFTDATGLDPYTHVSSDVYQDLMAESSYQGKGIYDLRAFNSVLSDRFPESHLLSHDLIEGGHVRVGLASDIELLDQFPGDYLAYTKRQHRWIRGDWQIADWLFPTVPGPRDQRVHNALSFFNRWKIADNLRRSLLPAASIALLLFGWRFTAAPVLVSVFVGSVMLLPPLVLFGASISTKSDSEKNVLRQLGISLQRAAICAVLLPEQAYTALDAIIRVMYRRIVSHRLLLQWETSQEVGKGAKKRERALQRLAAPPLCLGIICALFVIIHPAARVAALPFVGIWALAPMMIMWMNAPVRKWPAQSLSVEDQVMLRLVARQTWRYFDDFVGPETNWLPPDNYQADLRVEVAQRTSPTNIGLGLMANLAAADFGYITVDSLIDRTENTLKTMETMETFEGHILNWYDIRDLKPLLPRYVSMVDSGNLLGALWTVAQGLQELVSAPVLSPAALAGLQDTLRSMRPLQQHAWQDPDQIELRLLELENLAGHASQELKEIVHRVRLSATPASYLLEAVHRTETNTNNAVYWAEKVSDHVSQWSQIVDRYLRWVIVLEAPPEGGLLACGPDAHTWRRQALASSPSLRALATGNVPGLRELVGLQRRSSEMHLSPAVCKWLDDLAASASDAQRLASERLAECNAIINRLHHLADGMNMRFLYDATQRLFTTGYNVSDRRMDESCYNLLASEARLGSFIAIANGQIPVEHWWALGRPYGEAYGQKILLSWGGTMFEYLMPLLLTRSYENSLLDQACRAVVSCQISYGKMRSIPWGISESSYSAVDAQRTYQYRAFGVPGLGLKRGLEDDLVVSPYSSALALALEPAASAKNLRKLASLPHLEMHDGYGFYESIDYTRQQNQMGRRGIVVRSFMAHHQGMILSAIDNAINENTMQERFHRDPRVCATESLLFERIPSAPAITGNNPQQEVVPRVPATVAPSPSGRVDTPNTAAPQTNLLSNGNFSVMTTNAGGGGCQWQNIEISRWRSDVTCDSYGEYLYLKNIETRAVWSATHQPVLADLQQYLVTFSSDKTEFCRRDGDIETRTEIVVSPEDNVEVRRVTLVNRSRQHRTIELTSYVELALSDHRADRAHPAFNKLFVETEMLAHQSALLAHRRPRSPSDPPIWAVHVSAADECDILPQFETDRAQFIGRGRTAKDPAAMHGDLTGTAGFVLDPIFSLRRRVTVESGQRIQIAFVTGAAASREEAVAIADKYSTLQSSDRAIEMAWAHAQLELRHLGIHQQDTQAFQQLAAHIFYPSALLRPSPERLIRNTLGQSSLWAQGISGDLPIVTVTIGDTRDIVLVRQVLLARSYLLARGLKMDLILLNEEPDTYGQPLLTQLRRLMEAFVPSATAEQPGGVFLRSADQVQEPERTLLLTASRIVFVAARGGLQEQLSAPAIGAATAPALLGWRNAAEAGAPLPVRDLTIDNGVGGFTCDGNEYVIHLDAGCVTPLPWVNVMSNKAFGTIVSESGSGFTWSLNSQTNRLTPWSNDPISDTPGDVIYIRDEESTRVWTPTALPIREQEPYRTTHGKGYTHAEHNSHGINQVLTTFVPVDAEGGSPVRLQRLSLTNLSNRRRRLSITLYCEWVLGTEREDTQLHVSTQWDAVSQCLFARNPFHPDDGGRVTFVTCSAAVLCYTGDRTEFLGRNGSLSAPAAMSRTRLSGRVGAGLDPCGAYRVQVLLEPREKADVVFVLGQAANVAEARELAAHFRTPRSFETALKTTRDWWSNVLNTVQVQTPSVSVDFMMNGWLLYQALSCRIWGRSAFYQSGGAYGFRDQLQDSMALVYAAPDIAREQILRAAARQFPEGDVQHWWHPGSGAGVRTRISDDMLWLPFVTAHYVRVTGDTGILDTQVPFIQGKLIAENGMEAFYSPTITSDTATLLEHCRRSIEKGSTSGIHGLPLIGSGDWNDGLNLVGKDGKGESVWLAWFLVCVLNDFANTVLQHGASANPTALIEATKYREQAEGIAKAVDDTAWDGAWYRRGYFDNGDSLGSVQNEEAQIDSIAQSWSAISAAGDPVRAIGSMQAVMHRLVLEQEKMVLLFAPPFASSAVEPGYIKGYPPGVRENGGQYTHGSLWVPMALARLGDGNNCNAVLEMMNPISHTRTPADIKCYKAEPYVVAADVYALPGRVGRAGWSWYTGAAAWMYRIWLEEVLGFQVRGNQLSFHPCFKNTWVSVEMTYRYHGSQFNIQIRNPAAVSSGVKEVSLDGVTCTDGVIALLDDGATHTIVVLMGQTA